MTGEVIEPTTYPHHLYQSADSYATMMEFYDKCLADLPVAVEPHYVDTRFGRTHMLVAGPPDAPPLFMLQGMAGSAVLWHHQLADFARQCRLYALDVVGQPGRSDPNPPSIFDDSYAHWLMDVQDGLGLERCDMMGISISGWAIMRLGIIRPERLRKAVLLSPLRLARAKMNGGRWVGNAMKPDTEDDKLEDRLTARDFNVSSGRTQFDRRLARNMALATRHYKLAAGMGIDPEAGRVRKFGTGARVLSKFASPAPEAELKQFRTPALVVMGENEALYNPDKAAARARLMPNARVVVVPEAGHAAVFDRPDVINPIILDFLAEPD
jgi:pimeloyl-ACP methyl ester carboxylesterase